MLSSEHSVQIVHHGISRRLDLGTGEPISQVHPVPNLSMAGKQFLVQGTTTAINSPPNRL